jgi:hypothetical protein
MAISNNLITTVASAIYTAPGSVGVDNFEYAVTCMIFCNYDPINDVTLDVWLVPVGTPGISNQTKVIHELTIPAGETFTFDTEKLVLATGDRIFAEASANTRLTVSKTSMRVS